MGESVLYLGEACVVGRTTDGVSTAHALRWMVKDGGMNTTP